jgi:hypothetical protein
LQDEDGGYLIDDRAVLGSGAAGSVQVAVGLGSGQALVPEVDWQRGFFAKNLCKSLGFGRLGALVAGHVERIAYDDSYALVFAEKALERLQILLSICAHEGENGLRGKAERIGDGYADPPVADIETHDPRG